MQEYLHKYFALHKKLILPGLGSFHTNVLPAQLNFIDKTIHAPIHTIFHDTEIEAEDEKFYSYLSKETGLHPQEALDKFFQFIEHIKSQLDQGDVIELQGIGTLTKNKDGYSLEPDNAVQKFFQPLTAERVVRQNVEHFVTVGEHERTSTQMHQELFNKAVIKKESWWISAIILGTIGMAAIAYYYFVKH